MVKKAYKKLLSYPIVRMSIIGILLTIFVYRLLLFVTYGDEVSQTIIKWICLGFADLHISIFFISMIRYVIQVQKASHYFHTLPAYAKERLEYDLQTGDRLDDMYFTSEFLFVYQLQFRKKQGFACIPYKEIAEVRISHKNKNVLEILNSQGTVLHMAVFLHAFDEQQVAELNQKIFSLKNREQSVRTTEGEQAVREYIAKQKISERRSSGYLRFCSYSGISVFHGSGGTLSERSETSGDRSCIGVHRRSFHLRGRNTFVLAQSAILCSHVWSHVAAFGLRHYICPESFPYNRRFPL